MLTSCSLIFFSFIVYLNFHFYFLVFDPAPFDPSLPICDKVKVFSAFFALLIFYSRSNVANYNSVCRHFVFCNNVLLLVLNKILLSSFKKIECNNIFIHFCFFKISLFYHEIVKKLEA